MRGTVISSIRQFLASIDAKIHLDNPMIRPKLRKNDICIMDEAIKLFSTKSELEKVNAVREFLNVHFLSEMSEPNGTTLAKGFLFGNSGDHWYRRRISGPKQTKPNNESWKLWRELVDTFL